MPASLLSLRNLYGRRLATPLRSVEPVGALLVDARLNTTGPAAAASIKQKVSAATTSSYIATIGTFRAVYKPAAMKEKLLRKY